MTSITSREAFLRADVQVEPLIDRWYAWLHVLAPVQGALAVRQQLGIFDSYLASPKAHADAAANPSLRGGPFMDYGRDRSDEVRALRAEAAGQADVLGLAQAVADLDELLLEPDGYALDPYVPRVPAPLRGLVELVYDRRHRASFRLIEPLVYRSRHYRTERQTVDIARADRDVRPFILSTARLPEDGHLQLPLPFAAPEIDDLCAARLRPVRVADMAEALGVAGDAERDVLASLFTSEPQVSPDRHWDADDVRVRYFGHACVLVQHRGVCVLVDPFVCSTPASPGALPRYTYADLPDRIDMVLLTHGHQDHLVLETLLQLRHRIGTVVVPATASGLLEDPSLRLALHAAGFPSVVELGAFDELRVGDGSVTACPFVGEHADLAIGGKATYLLRLGGQSVLFAADVSSRDEQFFANVQQAVGKVDTVFLGMECDGAPLTWLYGPLFGGSVDRAMSRSRKLSGSDADQAVDIVRSLGASKAYVYAMGREPWLQHITPTDYREGCFQLTEAARFTAACDALSVEAAQLYGCAELLLRP